jgi:hypothetical protein
MFDKCGELTHEQLHIRFQPLSIRDVADDARAADHSARNILEGRDSQLARCYERLAEQAERNGRLDTSYEPMLRA